MVLASFIKDIANNYSGEEKPESSETDGGIEPRDTFTIQSGEEKVIPITMIAKEPSELKLHWMTQDAADVEWGVFFEAAEGDQEQPKTILQDWELSKERTVTFNAPVAGAYKLHWKNNQGGWFGGGEKKISYELEVATESEKKELERFTKVPETPKGPKGVADTPKAGYPSTIPESAFAPGASQPSGTDLTGKTLAEWEKDQGQFAHLPALPKGWIRVRSRQTPDDIYYCCKDTGVVTSVEPTATGEDLPPGWAVKTSRSTGQQYYWNTLTNETQFDKPTQSADTPKQPAQPGNDNDGLLPGWVSMISRSTGQMYYFNSQTKESQFERPTA